MRIAVDASRLAPENLTGTQNYLYNVIHELSLIDSFNTYDIFFRHDVSQNRFDEMTSSNKNFSCICLKKSISWTQYDFAKYLLRNKYDVLFSPWQTMPIIHDSRMKIVSVIHGLEYKKFRFGPTLYTVLFSDKVIAVSEFTKREIIKEYRVSPNKVCVVHEGVNNRVFYKRSAQEIEKMRAKYNIFGAYILFVGTAVPRKNIPRMLEAFSQFVHDDSRGDISFVIAGNVPDEYKNIYDLPSKFNIEKQVKFTGHIEQDDLPALMSGAEFLAYVSESEGFGLPVLEAMSCGVPVLTSKAGALIEVAGDAAVLVDPYITSQIKEGINALINNKDLRQELMKKGEKNVERFSWHSCASSILGTFEAMYEVT